MALVRTLIDCDEGCAEPSLPKELRELYDGDLQFRAASAARPYVIANFVSTLDGVASYEMKGNSGGSAISGSDPTDRFIMGLLRASADAIVVGARTIQDVSAKSLWTPEYVFPDAKRLYAEYRIDSLHKPEYPLLAIVSGSGELELDRAVFHASKMRTVVITTSVGRDKLLHRGASIPGPFEIRVLDSSTGRVAPQEILQLLNLQFGVERVLHEGGPTLFGQFLAAGLVDELFLTLSPQIAGRDADAARPGVVAGVGFAPKTAPWFQMASLKQNAAYLYLRYRQT